MVAEKCKTNHNTENKINQKTKLQIIKKTTHLKTK